MWNFIVAALLASSPGPATAGNVCTEVADWSAVPAEVRTQIEQVEGVGGVAEAGTGFNATDVLQTGLPRSRFFGACHEGETWLVALERGGRGRFLQLWSVRGHGAHSLGTSSSAPSFKSLLERLAAQPQDGR